MKVFSILILAITCSLGIFGQNIKLTGTVRDPTNAIIPGVNVKATSQDGRQFITKSDSNGDYLLELLSGVYRLEFDSPGFKTNIVSECSIKDGFGEMNVDVVLRGRTDHEPCGYGGDCGNTEEIKIEKPILQDNISLRPIIEVPKQTKPITKKKSKYN